MKLGERAKRLMDLVELEKPYAGHAPEWVEGWFFSWIKNGKPKKLLVHQIVAEGQVPNEESNWPPASVTGCGRVLLETKEVSGPALMSESVLRATYNICEACGGEMSWAKFLSRVKRQCKA